MTTDQKFNPDLYDIGAIIAEAFDGPLLPFERISVYLALGRAAERHILDNDTVPLSEIIAQEFQAMRVSHLTETFQGDVTLQAVAGIRECHAAKATA